MINLPLLKTSFKKTGKLLIGLTIIISFYLLMTAGMYDPTGESDPFNAFPDSMRAALGMELGPQTIEGFLSTGFYSAAFLIFMIIFSLLVANQLLVTLVDRGSMAYLLTTPVARKKIVSTQAGVLVLSLLFISTLTTIVGIFGINAFITDVDLNISIFLQINIVAFLLFFVIGGYAFLFSSIFNETKWAFTASGGITFVFYLLNILSNSTSNVEWLKYLTLFTAFQPLDIVKGTMNVPLVSFGLGIAGIVLYTLSIVIFSKRNLPL
jgi:ABC-2 type transport system permease protein